MKDGTGTNSTTVWKTDGHGGFSGESVLAHELQHASDVDKGILDKKSDKNKNGYADSEDKGVDTGNDYRKANKETLRDDYGDVNNDSKKRKFDPKSPFSPFNENHCD